MLPNNAVCEKLPELPKKCLGVLYKNWGDGDEINKKMAELVADTLLHYFHPAKNNVPKPLVLDTYEHKTRLEKIEFDKKYPDWWRKQDVQDYWRADSEVRSGFASNVYWLTYWEGLLREAGDLRHLKIAEKLAEFNKKIIDPQVDRVTEMFSGSVKGWEDEEE